MPAEEALYKLLDRLAGIGNNILALLDDAFVFCGDFFDQLINAGDETARTEARNIMIWGIIALFVMVSVWGLVNVLDDTFGLDDQALNPPSLDDDRVIDAPL